MVVIIRLVLYIDLIFTDKLGGVHANQEGRTINTMVRVIFLKKVKYISHTPLGYEKNSKIEKFRQIRFLLNHKCHTEGRHVPPPPNGQKK